MRQRSRRWALLLHLCLTATTARGAAAADPLPPCGADRNLDCEEWALEGLCADEWYRTNCALSCGGPCDAGPRPTTAPVQAPTQQHLGDEL
mmetsp:Transcript_26221/g.104933  ORF Transcript_26221/g.104933 Transcript_26221/m.104933 type:complete len:91 (+) Transcript_26221:69-341(+)